jgi:hypothetical protein
MLAPFILLFGYIVSGFLGVRFDSPSAVLRHLAAFPNCSVARAVGLALRIWENRATGRRTTPTMTA